jgi:2-C-methyl-D-erythritol 2,4-cyclodiphosphate synthase
MKPKYRTGIGYDVHRLAPGNGIVLGGVAIQATVSVVAHSDGDVLLHAICDALLGAAALRDIGYHFPDSNQRYKGISSLELLKHVAGLIQSHGYTVCNVDSVVILEKPKIGAYVDRMCAEIAAALGIDSSLVSVKATTSEGLGFTGTGEGIAAEAVAMIESIEEKNM